jgi:uncharacterized protein YbjT (DUF2867 family)
MVALVIGATGMVGSQLIQQLLTDDRFEKIRVFSRRALAITHPKLEEHLINFDYSEQWKDMVRGDVLFSALGTTLSKAGSKGAQFKIDYKYQYLFAKVASENGVPQYVLVSAAYASPGSKIFYSRMKGILEKDVKKLSYQNITILKPGMLSGDRKEERTGEKIGIAVFNVLHHLPGLKFLKPVSAATVAKAMINATQYYPQHINEYSLGEIFTLAGLNKKYE